MIHRECGPSSPQVGSCLLTQYVRLLSVLNEVPNFLLKLFYERLHAYSIQIWFRDPWSVWCSVIEFTLYWEYRGTRSRLARQDQFSTNILCGLKSTYIHISIWNILSSLIDWFHKWYHSSLPYFNVALWWPHQIGHATCALCSGDDAKPAS